MTQEEKQKVYDMALGIDPNSARASFLRMMKESDADVELLSDGRFRFKYKDETLVIDAPADSVVMRLYDYSWMGVSRWDVEKVTEVQQRINTCNITSRARAVYYFDDESDEMLVSGELVAPLSDKLKEVEAYFAAQLDVLLDLHMIADGMTENDIEENDDEGNDEN